MEKKKIWGFILGMALFGTAPLFPQDLADLQRAAGEFSGALAKSLPFNSALGLNWADAYVGMFLPGIPPHFGAGIALGYTTMDLEVFDGLLRQFDLSVPGGFNLGRMVFPGYVAEARIGGFILPFDAGLKFGVFENLGNSSGAMDYFLGGGEFRYALIDGKKNLLLPNLSLGVGLNYLSGSFTGSKSSLVISVPPGATVSGGDTLALSNVEAGLRWETMTLDFKAQVSKSFLIITPYAGLGTSHAWSNAGYSVEADIPALSDADRSSINAALENAGLEGVDFSGRGFSTTLKETGWSFRVFGGVSVNLALFRLDLTGLYNFSDGNYGVTLGGRFQI
ncbi:MAG: hypothetical protein LBG07_09705 [Treponema sp.]|jgi:hypothetical protein|nr:hypothetical protein [Treponema sp.]